MVLRAPNSRQDLMTQAQLQETTQETTPSKASVTIMQLVEAHKAFVREQMKESAECVSALELKDEITFRCFRRIDYSANHSTLAREYKKLQAKKEAIVTQMILTGTVRVSEEDAATMDELDEEMCRVWGLVMEEAYDALHIAMKELEYNGLSSQELFDYFASEAAHKALGVRLYA